MTDERARHNLYRAIEDLLGTKQTDTLMALLPPVGWADVATKDDLHQLEARLDAGMHARFAHERGWADARFARERRWADARFATKDDLHQLEARLDAGMHARFARQRGWAEARFETIDTRFARIETRFAQLDGSIDRSMREQTRTLMFGLLGALLTMTSLCLGAVSFTA